MTDADALARADRTLADIDRTLVRSRALRCWLVEAGVVRA